MFANQLLKGRVQADGILTTADPTHRPQVSFGSRASDDGHGSGRSASPPAVLPHFTFEWKRCVQGGRGLSLSPFLGFLTTRLSYSPPSSLSPKVPQEPLRFTGKGGSPSKLSEAMHIAARQLSEDEATVVRKERAKSGGGGVFFLHRPGPPPQKALGEQVEELKVDLVRGATWVGRGRRFIFALRPRRGLGRFRPARFSGLHSFFQPQTEKAGGGDEAEGTGGLFFFPFPVCSARS